MLYMIGLGLGDERDITLRGIEAVKKSRNFFFVLMVSPISATTHSDLVVRAKKLGVNVEVVHNASVMNAVGICGLQLYHYGETVSIPFCC